MIYMYSRIQMLRYAYNLVEGSRSKCVDLVAQNFGGLTFRSLLCYNALA
jgi:hypothetical protein